MNTICGIRMQTRWWSNQRGILVRLGKWGWRWGCMCGRAKSSVLTAGTMPRINKLGNRSMSTLFRNRKKIPNIYTYGKEPAFNVGILGLIPGLGRSPGEGKGYPLQYSCLENPTDRGSLVGYSPWSHKHSNTTEWLTLSLSLSHAYTHTHTNHSPQKHPQIRELEKAKPFISVTKISHWAQYFY